MSGLPRAMLRPAAAIRPASRLGRIWLISAEMGLASFSAGVALPPPKRSASRAEMKDQLTASTMPLAASARRAVRSRRWRAERTGFATAWRRGRATDFTSESPCTRTTSSTRSASPSTSGRHDGTETESFAPASDTPKPSAERIVTASDFGSESPVSFSIRAGSNSIPFFVSGTLPATTTLDGSPPHMPMIIFVASSRPGRTNSGSTPRSKR